MCFLCCLHQSFLKKNSHYAKTLYWSTANLPKNAQIIGIYLKEISQNNYNYINNSLFSKAQIVSSSASGIPFKLCPFDMFPSVCEYALCKIRSFKFTLYFTYVWSRISHFFKEPCLLLVGNGIKKQRLGHY